ncbi:MAG: hypothetical protein PVJ82_06380, partial [Desulfobacteraceae bacterium]
AFTGGLQRSHWALDGVLIPLLFICMETVTVAKGKVRISDFMIDFTIPFYLILLLLLDKIETSR